MNNENKVLVIRQGAFGDIVQSSGALQDIREFHSNSEIILLTEPTYRKLMSRCPFIDRTLPDNREPIYRFSYHIHLAKMLRRENFTRVYDLQSSNRNKYYRHFFLSSVPWFDSATRNDPTVNSLNTYHALLEAAGVPVVHATAPDASWMATNVDDILSQENVRANYILLIPGCSAKHPQKRWPYYQQLASALIERGHEVVTAPGPDELELARGIPGHTLLGEKTYLDWFELAGVIQHAAFVIGNDTGPSHIASCMNHPGLVLFGAHTSARKTGILRERFQAIEVKDLAELAVGKVLTAVLRELDQAGANRSTASS